MKCHKSGTHGMERILLRKAFFFILQQKWFGVLYTLINFANKIFQYASISFHSVCFIFLSHVLSRANNSKNVTYIIIIATDSREKGKKFIFLIAVFTTYFILCQKINYINYTLQKLLLCFPHVTHQKLSEEYLLKIFIIKQKL